jgi:protein phosphatase
MADMIRRGALLPEEAAHHRLRHVITNVVGGNEAGVNIESRALDVQAGDRLLLCSDGLTEMLTNDAIVATLRAESDPRTACTKLVAQANEAGGRDNITVILFRLEEVEGRRGDAGGAGAEPTAEYDTFAAEEGPGASGSPTAGGDDHGGALRASDEAEAEYRRTGTMALPALRAADPRQPAGAEGEAAAAPAREPPPRTMPLPEAGRAPRRRRRSRLRRLARGVVVALALIAPVLVGGWIASRLVYFVGTDRTDRQTITIFRGLPYDLPGGIRLYERYAGSGVTLQQVPARRRATFTNHKLRSRDDAENLVIALERGRLE